MSEKRIARLNSLLQEVISTVIHHEVKNPHLPHFITVTKVEITEDLSHAKIYVSIMASEPEQKKAIEILSQAAGFIAFSASKKMTIRYFPELRFILDQSMEKQSRVDELLRKVEEERIERKSDAS